MNEAGDDPGKQTVVTGRTGIDTTSKRTGVDVPSQNSMLETQGLTDPSSATEAGESKLRIQKGRTASLCSLERVVRLAGWWQGTTGADKKGTDQMTARLDNGGLREGDDTGCISVRSLP